MSSWFEFKIRTNFRDMRVLYRVALDVEVKSDWTKTLILINGQIIRKPWILNAEISTCRKISNWQKGNGNLTPPFTCRRNTSFRLHLRNISLGTVLKYTCRITCGNVVSSKRRRKHVRKGESSYLFKETNWRVSIKNVIRSQGCFRQFEISIW